MTGNGLESTERARFYLRSRQQVLSSGICDKPSSLTPIRRRESLMANFLSQNWLLNRRHVLRGLGVTLALPLLDCMRPLRAAETKSRAKRSVFIYLPNGVNTIDYQITHTGTDYKFSNSLAPLEKHRATLPPPSGP